MARMITTELMESHSFNRGLFGGRRLHEGEARERARGRLADAVHAALMANDHQHAAQLMKHLRDYEDDADADDDLDLEEQDEDLEDQSQAGRREGPEKEGFANTANSSKGIPSMESRADRERRQHREAQLARYREHTLTESRPASRRVRDFAARLLA